MKKTQSLKLMLLGLLASVSMSSFAAVGDIFEWGVNDGAGGVLYFEEVAGGAKVIGVKTVGENGLIVIPTECKNNWYSPYAPLNVIALDDNWSASTQIVLKKFNADGTVASERPMNDPTVALTDLSGLTLQIDAAYLTTISTKAIQPLNGAIKKFVVSATAGLTAIPDYAFFNGKYDAAASAANLDPAVLAQQAALREQLYIVENRIDGFDLKDANDRVVYAVWNVTDGNGNPIYVIQGADPDGDSYTDAINALNGDAMGVSVKKSGNNLVKADGSIYAKKITATVKGLQEKYDDAVAEKAEIEAEMASKRAAYLAAKKVVDKAQAAVDAVAYVKKQIQTNSELNTLLSNASTAVINAIKQCITTPDPVAYEDWTSVQQGYFDRLKEILNADDNWPRTSGDKGYVIYNLGGIADAEANAAAALENAKSTDGNGETIAEYEGLEKDKKAQEAIIAAVKPLLDADKALAKSLQNQINGLNPEIPVYTATLDGNGKIVNNTVLEDVDLAGGAIASIGTSAFENCVAAKFVNQGGGNGANIPASTVTIADRAFYNTKKLAPIFGKLTLLESVGNEAFAEGGSITANFSNSPALKSFGEHVFDNCKLKNLLLAGTAIEVYPDYLAQCLFLETPKFVDDCGYFYNYDVTNAEDVAALKALGFDDQDIVNFEGGEAKVNQTLTKVSLPAAIKKIPDNAFMNDVALAELAGGIPAGVAYIGDMAFFRTKITEFDLSLLVDLYYVGDQAFAGNKEITTVTLPQGPNTKLQALGDGVFECDGKLGEVVLGPEITCLPEGTFEGNNTITSLDLSNTKIEVLHNLFGTGEYTKTNKYGETYKVEIANTALTEIILPEQVIDEIDNKTELIPGLKIIDAGALQYMQGLTNVTIPSSVFWMGDRVFYNDINLETVTAMDSRLVTIGANTFRNCRKLTTFTFVTLKQVDPYGESMESVNLDELLANEEIADACGLESLPALNAYFDDHNFFLTSSTTLVMTKESIKVLQETFPTELGFTNFQVWQPTLATHTDGTLPYYNENYATWISMNEADVYTCYQDVVTDPVDNKQKVKIYMIKAKHNQGFYKIPAATIMKRGGADGQISQIWRNWRPSNSVYEFPGYNDTFMDWYIDGPSYSYQDQQGQDYNSEDVNRLFTPSAAVIIVEKANGGADGVANSVPYERHSAANLIKQSTLDPGNQMKITRKPIGELSSSSNICWFAHTSDTAPNNWWPITSGTIPAGKLVLPLSAGEANGNDPIGPFDPSRIEVVWVDDEITGIMDVKDYIKSLRDSDAIYNLQGVKVTAPVKGQLYIQNGKKFIQK